MDSPSATDAIVTTDYVQSYPSLGTSVQDTPRPDTTKPQSSCLVFPPCVICSGKASGLHYGCNTCEACKNFFRRYLIRKKGYVCPEKSNCDISVNNKRNCSACRLARCLHFGMCKSKSQLGRYSYTRRTETIKKVKQLEERAVSRLSFVGNSRVSSFSKEIPITGREIIQAVATTFDESIVEQLTQNMADIKVYAVDMDDEEVRNSIFKEHHERYTNKVKMFGSMNAVSMEEYRVLLEIYDIDIDGYFAAWKRMSQTWEEVFIRYCEFAKKIPGFTYLCHSDQANLLKVTHCFAFSIMCHRGYSLEYNIAVEANGEAFHIEECSDKFVSRDCIEAGCKAVAILQKLELTKEEMALMVIIATFSSDLCQLEDSELVDKIQMVFVELLFKHLKSKFGTAKATGRFAKLLDSLTRMRDMADIYYREMKTLSQDEVVAKTMPLLLDFVPDDV